MYTLFLLVCVSLTILIALTLKDRLWVSSLFPLALSPLLLYFSGVVAPLEVWMIGTYVMTSLPIVLLKDVENKTTIFMSTMATLCASCAAETILLILHFLGCDIVTLFSTLSLVTWSTILFILLRKHYDHIRKPSYNRLLPYLY